jgi:hypothetical protein
MSTLKAVYAHLDSLVDAIAGLKRQGLKAGDMAVMAPLPRHEIEELLYEGEPSPVRWFTMCGAIFGGASGFTLCALTQVNWPMIIPAGKPLVSIPCFIIITFECTVLWASFLTLAGLIVNCRLPGFSLPKQVQDPAVLQRPLRHRRRRPRRRAPLEGADRCSPRRARWR